MKEKLYRACPHCGGRNTGWWTIGVEESQWFTTVIPGAQAEALATIMRPDGTVSSLLACGEDNWRSCPNLKTHVREAADLQADGSRRSPASRKK